MDLVKHNGQMVVYMKGIIVMIKSMELDYFVGQTEEDITELGDKVSSMVEDNMY
jgi:hypothetical protein